MYKYEIKFEGYIIERKKTINRMRVDKMVEVPEDIYLEAKKFEGWSASSQPYKNFLNRVIPFYFPNFVPSTTDYLSYKTFKTSSNKGNVSKIIAGAAVGYATAKIEKKAKNVRAKQEINVPNEKLPYSFSHKLMIFDNLNFDNCDEEKTKINLKYIYNNISSYNWEDAKNDSSGIILENNRSLNLCLGKFEEGLKRLKSLSENQQEINYFLGLHNELIKKRESNKPWSFKKKIIVGILLFLLGLLLIAIS